MLLWIGGEWCLLCMGVAVAVVLLSGGGGDVCTGGGASNLVV